MKIFSGFPDGKLQVTPLPNLFFSELLPAIDDLAELKLTLHIFWLLSHAAAKPGPGGKHPPFVSTRELLADVTLMQSLAAMGGKPDELLAHALQSATERGTLLRIDVRFDQTSESLYCPNTPTGRRALAQIEQGQIELQNPMEAEEPAVVVDRPNIFELYEQNIGFLNPMIADSLKEAEKEYPAEWIADAIKEAVDHHALNWKYISKVLENWKINGRGQMATKRKHWWDDDFDKFIGR